jgi:hypothetical protein
MKVVRRALAAGIRNPSQQRTWGALLTDTRGSGLRDRTAEVNKFGEAMTLTSM